MSVIVVLIGFSLFVAIGFLVAFLWSVKSGQYSDTYTPSVRMLFEDEKSKKEKESVKELKEEKKHDN
ncbi:MAG: cbb3-type cytochrome oxidase assembly protein CcoS [Ignavibacteriales bacterium]|nr:cbb3-type cytochrome oxidase assembly protein CcoS [Ignavibacteriales bacterium]MBP9119816.1 cbb3-type cytochrome oxidase assembly protein CcoS [Ignavibacterium sp.]